MGLRQAACLLLFCCCWLLPAGAAAFCLAPGGSGLCTPIELFRRQMAFLKNGGYRPVTMKEVLGFLRHQEPLPRKAVAITIDDGYRSVYDLAYPVLRQYKFPATLFIYTDFIGGSPNALSWEQLRQMRAAGFEVEAHTLSHADLTRRRKGESEAAYRQRLRKELELPRQLIREYLGVKVLWLAYPYGHFDNLVITMAKQAGYQAAVTVRRGSNPFFTDPFKVRRYQVLHPLKPGAFSAMLRVFHKERLQ